jgi:dsDNA-binding SOS-regulon protein
MAVVIQYVVVRNGVQKMVFTTKKEADAYDRMLDVAEGLFDFMKTAGLDINDKALEDLAYFMAENSDRVTSILKAVSSSAAQSPKKSGEGKEKAVREDEE